MAEDLLLTRLKESAARVFDIAPSSISLDTRYAATPEWDSVGHMDLLTALEEQFGFPLTPALIVRLTSVRAILKFLREHAGGPAEA